MEGVSWGIRAEIFQGFSARILLINTLKSPTGIPRGFLADIVWKTQKKSRRIPVRNVFRNPSSSLEAIPVVVLKQSQKESQQK